MHAGETTTLNCTNRKHLKSTFLYCPVNNPSEASQQEITDNVDNFIDDILIFTMTFKEHLQVLNILFDRLRLTAKPSKCALAYSSIECLGHVVGNENLKPNPDKIKSVQEATTPETKRQVRSF